MSLKIILQDYPVVWGVLRVNSSRQSARKRVGADDRKYETCSIFTIKSPLVCGESRQLPSHWLCGSWRGMECSQSRSELTAEHGSITILRQFICPVAHGCLLQVSQGTTLDHVWSREISGLGDETLDCRRTDLYVCGVLYWEYRSTPHTIRSKLFNPWFFIFMCGVSHR